MKIIGITGGIGSGKSTVSRILYDLGAKIVDADQIAKEVIGNDKRILKEITNIFGDDVLNNNGKLERKKLAQIVFKDINKLQMLDNITHKYIAEKITNTVERLRNEEAEMVVIDAPIPIKKGFIDLAEEIWAVVSDRDIRINRIMEKRGLDFEEAMDRINSQKKDEEYTNIAHKIIFNNGSIEQLENTVAKMFMHFKAH